MFNLPEIIKAAGYLGLFGIIFAETGLLFGFVLPGDSLLFTAGILASQGFLNVWWVIAALFVGVFLGDNTGYWIGRRLGPKIFVKDESIFFRKSHLEKSHAFFEKHGSKALILARFVPVVRTFAPTLAGVGKMKYTTFLAYSIIGSILWTAGLTLLGYYLGQVIPNVEVYIIPGVMIIILASISPFLYKFFKSPEMRAGVYFEIKKLFKKK